MWWQSKNIHSNQLTLEGDFAPYIPKYGDVIVFNILNTQYIYHVNGSYIEYVDGCNDKIFEHLGMTTIKSKMEFCEKVFGYEPKDGWCPECKTNDYPALGRLIRALQVECKIFNKRHNYVVAE
jgi:hypothetical protein